MHSSRMRTVRCSARLVGVGVCPRGVSAWGYLPGGSAYEGVSGQGMYTSPVDRMTDACENITFPQLLFWAVNISNVKKLKSSNIDKELHPRRVLCSFGPYSIR